MECFYNCESLIHGRQPSVLENTSGDVCHMQFTVLMIPATGNGTAHELVFKTQTLEKKVNGASLDETSRAP